MGLALHNKGYGHMGIFELHGSFSKQRGHHDGGGVVVVQEDWMTVQSLGLSPA